MKKILTTCPYCGTGCNMYLIVDGGEVVGVTPCESHPVSEGKLCIKGWKAHEFIHSPNRLTKPLIKRGGKFVEAPWDEALDLVAETFTDIADRHGPRALGFFSSARCTNEENYVMQKLARAAFKSNNIDHCARLCHASTIAGLMAAFGSGAMTNSVNELLDAKSILVTGSNTTEQHPIIGGKILHARERGAKLVVIDPREIQLAKHADVHLRPLPGTDIAWLNSFIHVILEEGLEDEKFIRSHLESESFEEMKNIVTCPRYSPEKTEKITSIPAHDLRRAAILFASNKPGSIVYSMGITQHIHGTDNVKSVANLQMILGNVGFHATGVNPLRGQNNVQGACDMGALPSWFPGYQPVTNSSIQRKMAEAWGVQVEDMDSRSGLTIVEMVKEAGRGDIKGLYIIGENPMVSNPNLNSTEKSLKEPFLVVQDLFMTPTAELADVVLPAASFAEKEGTYTSTQRTVSRIRRAIDPLGDSKPDDWIIGQIAKRARYEGCFYSSPAEILDEINRLVPIYAGITWKRIDSAEFPFGISWPCPTEEHHGTDYLHGGGNFSRGKGRCHICEYVKPPEEPDTEYPLRLTTGRIAFHFHTGTMTRRSPTLDREVRSAYIEINPADASELGIRHNGVVKVESRRGEITVRAEVSETVPRGVVFVPWHFKEAAANKLTNDMLDPNSKIPGFKVCAVKIERA